MRIRQELPADYAEVYSLIREAFATAEHADGNEQDLAAAFRELNAALDQTQTSEAVPAADSSK